MRTTLTAAYETPRLAGAAVIGQVAVGRNVRNVRATRRAGRVTLAVHLQEVSHLAVDVGAHAFLEHRHGVRRYAVDRVVQRRQLLFGERRQLLEREQPGGGRR